jgi:hypothetical protein
MDDSGLVGLGCNFDPHRPYQSFLMKRKKFCSSSAPCSPRVPCTCALRARVRPRPRPAAVPVSCRLGTDCNCAARMATKTALRNAKEQLKGCRDSAARVGLAVTSKIAQVTKLAATASCGFATPGWMLFAGIFGPICLFNKLRRINEHSLSMKSVWAL